MVTPKKNKEVVSHLFIRLSRFDKTFLVFVPNTVEVQCRDVDNSVRIINTTRSAINDYPTGIAKNTIALAEETILFGFFCSWPIAIPRVFAGIAAASGESLPTTV